MAAKKAEKKTNEEFQVTLHGMAAVIEKRFAPILAEMNSTPITIDKEVWAEERMLALTSYSNQLEELIRKYPETTGVRVNSSADCAAYFLKKGWEPSRLTAKGKPSMNEEVMAGLASTYTEAALILEARKRLGVVSQLDAWEPYVIQGTVQPQWNAEGTPMGRLSCEDPAMQNRVPQVRKTIRAKEGASFLSVDIKQAEYVTWASLAQDDVVLKWLQDGDLHQTMGEVMADFLPKNTDLRKAGKTINFALTYLMRAPTLAGMLRISTEQAESILKRFEERAGGLVAYRGKVIADAKESGEVWTYYGRQRLLPDLQSTDEQKQRQAVKTAWHHHNAGTAAEWVKLRMAEVADALIVAGLRKRVQFIIQMHDQFILQVDNDLLPLVASVVRVAMEKTDGVMRVVRFKEEVGSHWGTLAVR